MGAAFTVAPGFDDRVARACQEAGLAHLPGVATPTEIQQAMAGGFSWLKLFPAAELGASWVKAVLAPFPQLRIVATGGMSSANAQAFLAAGARAIAIGGSIRNPGEIEALARLARSRTHATAKGTAATLS
jgi:Entner-Doudoroff aldolase